MNQSSNKSGSSWEVLRYPDFRWMFIAQLISTIGSSMQLAAINWHIFNVTQSPIALGLAGLVRVGPIIVLSLLGGVIADAVDRRRLMVFTQSGMLIFAGILAVVTLTGHDSLVVIYLITAALSGLTAFDQPARNALMPNLVPSEQIPNAARLNVLMFQVTSVLGPVAAGLLIKYVGPGVAYLANSLSFIPVVIVLIMIHVPPLLGNHNREISLRALGEGLQFVRHSPVLWGSMVLDFFATFFASAMALLPIYASNILKVGADGYGVLYAAPSIGAVLGAALMAQYGGRIKRQGEVLLGSVAVYGLATIFFGLSNVFLISAIALAFTGLSDSISTAIRGTLRQIITPDRLRGRMLSVNMIFFMGGPQLGEFEAGALAQITSVPLSVVVGGVGAIAIVAWLALRVPALREYRELPVAAAD